MGEQAFNALAYALSRGLWGGHIGAPGLKGLPTAPSMSSYGRRSLWEGFQGLRGTRATAQALRNQVRDFAGGWRPGYGTFNDEHYQTMDRLLEELRLHPLPADNEAYLASQYQDTPGEFTYHHRYGEAVPPDSKAEKLQQLIHDNPLPVDLNVYRGFGVGPSSSTDRRPLVELPREGDILGSRSFMSTSVDPQLALSFASPPDEGHSYLADIYLPEGFPALPLRSGSNFDSERELLLPPETRYRVIAPPEKMPNVSTKRMRLEAIMPGSDATPPYSLTQSLPKPVPQEALDYLQHKLEFQPEIGQKLLNYITRDEANQRGPRGLYGSKGVYGYIAGLGPLAALATPSIMDLYSQEGEQ